MEGISSINGIAFLSRLLYNAPYQKSYIAQGQISKELKPGRLLVVSHQRHYNKLAILLQVHNTREVSFSVLVLDDQGVNDAASDTSGRHASDPLWHRMLALSARHEHYQPDGIGGHRVLVVLAADIVDVTRTTMRVDADRILQNWQQRQIPRFRDAPPGQTVVQTVNELANLNADVGASRVPAPASLDCKRDLDQQTQVLELQRLRNRLMDAAACTMASNFESEFGLVFERKKLEQQRDQLRFYVSKESYALYPDYVNKLKVLRSLQYIDGQDAVTMKGRVACEMGSNELIITELVLCNTFTDLEPDEIPALLSGLVFQAKTDIKPKLTPNLEKVCTD